MRSDHPAQDGRTSTSTTTTPRKPLPAARSNLLPAAGTLPTARSTMLPAGGGGLATRSDIAMGNRAHLAVSQHTTASRPS